MEGILAGFSFVNLLAGFALGIMFGAKVRKYLSAGLEAAAAFIK